ncbi:MAG: AmmeMemoRadiSam system radical SAM enzyme [Elusimicrobia bacterium]|nr:AmmeMemoRadiSam system radical SAM enzyme [Elusimicrobiota bacterium]
MTLLEQLRKYSAPALLAEKLSGGACRCLACAHKCVIADKSSGRCKARFNDGGALKAPWGYIAGSGLDPIEKKPFFHVLPGALTFSFGMLGCNFKCDFCQNYLTSQALRDPGCPADIQEISAGELVAAARSAGVKLLVSTYNEPLITSEWAAEIFAGAKAAGMRCAYVSNGYASQEALEYLRPLVDFYKVDLKTFNPENYLKTAGGKLEHVLNSIKKIHELGFWLEIVTLLIPGFNDSPAELAALASFLAGISKDIPWHITAFHPDYRMTDREATPPGTLAKARETGLRKGLKYVYTGNIPGRGFEDTCCPACGRTLVRRRGFTALENAIRVSERGAGDCPGCCAEIAGVWS